MFHNISTYLINNIRPFAKYASGGSEINCRCPYCGDSTDQRKGHLYIKNVPGHVFQFYCQKCNTSGYITNNTLLDWGIFDPDISTMLSQYNKNCIGTLGTTNIKYRKYRLNTNFISDTKYLPDKVKYIEDRLGITIDKNFITNNKIILNLFDFINHNHLEVTRHSNIMKQLDDCFIGFLSYDNSFINMRNLGFYEVYKNINKRYINYNVFNNVNSSRFYIIPSSYDILSLNPIRVNISEGPFDILSIFSNLRNQNRFNEIYIAAIGNTYESAIKFIITNLEIINLEIHLYVDNDVKQSKLSRFKYVMSPYKFNIYIHHNTYNGEKDFGVPLSRIIDNMYPL